MVRRRCAIFMGVLIAVSAVVAVGQTVPNPNTDVGISALGSHHGGDFDSVGLMGGNLNLHVPLICYPQRGDKLSLCFFIRYNNKGFIGFPWQVCTQGSCVQTYKWLWRGNGVEVVRGGALGLQDNSQSVPIPNCPGGPDYCNPVTIQMLNAIAPDGGSHLLSGLCTDMTCPTGANPGDAIALDASGVHYLFQPYSPSSCLPGFPAVIEANGVRHVQQTRSYTAVQGSCPPQPATPGYWAYDLTNGTPVQRYDSTYVSSSVDPNGNTISVSSSGWVDTLGRLIPGSAATTGDYGATNKYEMILPGVPTSDFSNCPGPTASARIWNAPGPNSGTSTFKLCYSDVPLATNFHTPYPCGVPGGGTCYYTEWNFTVRLLTAVVLPDLSFWKFDYNNYGDLAKVTLPTGGSISYTWTNIGWETADINTPVSRTVSTRTVDANDGTGGHTWTYQWATPASGFAFTQVTVTDPLQNDTVHTFSEVVGYQDLHETKTQFYHGSYSAGTLLKTVDTQYSGSSNPFDIYNFPVRISDTVTSTNVVPISTATTWANGQKSQTTYAYDSGTTYYAFDNRQGTLGTWSTYTAIYGSGVRTDDYDFGNGSVGALVRSRRMAYQWQSNSNYLSANLLDLPSSVVIQDANGNKMAETDYTCDESQYLSASNIGTQHGAAPNAVRGNLTTVSKWLNTSSNPVVTHTNWYDTGEVYQAIDPLGNTTTHSYSSSFAGAYPTQTCNALSQCISGNYDFNTGLLTSFIDVNGNTSNYSYDLMSRLTLAQSPADSSGNRPQMSFTYSQPNSFPLNVQRTKSTTASLNDVATIYFDGLGRVYQSQHATPNGNATVATAYDALGHPISVTNPYFTTGDPTYGVTTTQYDGIGRVTKSIKQDNSAVTVQYNQTSTNSPNGDCTLTTDEAGKSRKTCLDGLSRLIEVDEPQPSTGGMSNPYVTLYSYDTLGNLLSVNQKGDGSQAARVRTFTYDSLSRLLTATNPESGQVSYTYDANGNVLQKTSPAPNQTGSSTQTISHCYDKLNRVTGKAYSAQTCQSGPNGPESVLPGGTAVVGYTYDAGTNGIGHLTNLTDQAGSGSYSYDALGRITSEQRTIAGITKNLSYTYNLDNSVATLKYPSGGVIAYTPDSAGRMLSAVDASNNINYVTGAGGPNPGSGATYGPDGSILSYNQGWTTSFAGIANTFTYSPRLQPVNMSATSPGTTGTSATANVTISGDLATAQNASFVTAQPNSPITMASPGDFYYLDNAGHVREATLTGPDQWANWINADITAGTGALAAISGSQLTGYKDSSGRTYVLYVNSAQHLAVLYYNNNWSAEDLGSTFGGVVAAAGTPIVMASPGDFYYLDNGGHVHEATVLSNGTWASWTDADITAGTGAPAAMSGSQLVGYKDGSGRTYVLHVNSAQHLAVLYYNNSNWSAEDLGSTFGGIVAAAGTPIVMASPGDFYYLDNGGHVHEATVLSNGTWASWTDADITAGTGAPAAMSGSQLVGYKDGAGRTYVLHVNSAQHLEVLYYNNNWYAEDLGSTFGGVVAAAGTPIVMASPGDFYYLDNGQHVHEATLLSNGTWAGWTDADITALAGAPAAISRSQLTGYKNGSGNTYVLQVNSSQHLASLWYNNGWSGIDLGVTSLTEYDAGVVSLMVGEWSATACYGTTSNPLCSGLSVNRTASEIAGVLVQGLNASGSPVTASASGAAINMTWKATGPFTTPVSALSTTHDNPSLFPNPSFTSPATNFSGGTGANLSVFSLTYNFNLGNGDNGNVIGITNNRDSTRSQSFTYDYLNRLTSARNAGSDCTRKTANNLYEYWGNTYTYDAWGNLTNKTVMQNVTPPTCSGENLNVTVFTNNQLVGYGYDAAGNMTSDPTPPAKSYIYDAENRITSATMNGATTTYNYDSDGNRVEKSNGSTGTIYWYMTPGIVAESDLSGNLKSEYVFFDGERVARKDFAGGTTSVAYYFSDHLKTASVITNSAGVITEDEDYYPWGGELQFVNSDANHYKFTGKERDTETQLDYFGARYYGNWYGRFLSADWSAKPEAVPYSDLHDPQSLNLYSYVRNIPTSNSDPDGHDVFDFAPGIQWKEDPIEPSECAGLSSCSSDDGPPLQRTFGDFLNTARKAINKEIGNTYRFVDNIFCKADASCAAEDMNKEKKASSPQEARIMLLTSIALLFVPVAGEEKGAVEVAELYARFSKEGEFLKWGISKNPATRYTPKELEGGSVMRLVRGSRERIVQLERWLTERAPGPLNHEPWAGSKYSDKALRAVERLLDRIFRDTI